MFLAHGLMVPWSHGLMKVTGLTIKLTTVDKRFIHKLGMVKRFFASLIETFTLPVLNYGARTE